MTIVLLHKITEQFFYKASLNLILLEYWINGVWYYQIKDELCLKQASEEVLRKKACLQNLLVFKNSQWRFVRISLIS